MAPDPREQHESTAVLTEGWHYTAAGPPWAVVTREGDTRLVYVWTAADPHPSQNALRSMFALSPMQARVLQMLLTRRTNAEIAAQLGIKVTTTRRHVEAVLFRLGIESRWDVEARVYAAAAQTLAAREQSKKLLRRAS